MSAQGFGSAAVGYGVARCFLFCAIRAGRIQTKSRPTLGTLSLETQAQFQRDPQTLFAVCSPVDIIVGVTSLENSAPTMIGTLL